jgi:hypothetical protein
MWLDERINYPIAQIFFVKIVRICNPSRNDEQIKSKKIQPIFAGTDCKSAWSDNKTTIQKYKRENTNGYVSPKRTKSKPEQENRDTLKELEECGLVLK